MKDGCERVWLKGADRLALRRLKGESGVSVSGLIRECVHVGLKNVDVKGLAQDVLLKVELEQLFGELKRLRRLQNAILCNGPYLRDYAHDLMLGAYKNPAFVEVRRSLLSYPGADKLLPALEVIVGRRNEIHVQLCEISRKLYPDVKYPLFGELKTEYREKRMRPLRGFEGKDQRDLQDEVRRLRSRRHDNKR